jgi:hypothetical protein
VLGDEAAAETVLTGFSEKLETSSFITDATIVSSQKTGTGQEFEIRCVLAH